jgi:hypothetical protein
MFILHAIIVLTGNIILVGSINKHGVPREPLLDQLVD